MYVQINSEQDTVVGLKVQNAIFILLALKILHFRNCCYFFFQFDDNANLRETNNTIHINEKALNQALT